MAGYDYLCYSRRRAKWVKAYHHGDKLPIGMVLSMSRPDSHSIHVYLNPLEAKVLVRRRRQKYIVDRHGKFTFQMWSPHYQIKYWRTKVIWGGKRW